MMKNPLDKNKGQVIIPVLIGAAAAAALAYFLISEDTAELREELTGSLEKAWDEFKDRAMDRLTDLKSKVDPMPADMA